MVMPNDRIMVYSPIMSEKTSMRPARRTKNVPFILYVLRLPSLNRVPSIFSPGNKAQQAMQKAYQPMYTPAASHSHILPALLIHPGSASTILVHSRRLVGGQLPSVHP